MISLFKSRFLILLGIFILSTTLAPGSWAKNLSPASVLRKMSFQLRGQNPSPEEYSLLNQAIHDNNVSHFLSAKADEYLKTSEHVFIMSNRVKELLRLKTDLIPLSSRPDSGGTNPGTSNESLSILINDILRQNLSWDQLLTAKNYRVVPYNSEIYVEKEPPAEFSFFKDIANFTKTNKAMGTGFVEFKSDIAHDDLRVAGILTTPRFAKAYVNTAVNKNRKRAAAIYRTFLCDDMIASVGSNAVDRKNKFLQQGFAAKTEDDLRQELAAAGDTRHGTQADCMACHVKLDPMGKTLSGMTSGQLSTFAFPGALVLRRNNQIVSQDVQGVGELAQKITEQPEYASCQVRWFWKEFIGVNKILSQAHEAELVQIFDQVGRKPNDFIKYLLLSEDFSQIPVTESEIVFSQVKTLLQRCDACHGAMDSEIPTFSQLPISLKPDGSDQAIWLGKMLGAMNLPEGDRQRMPREYRKWRSEEIDLIKNWLNQGARDDSGKQLFNPTEPR